nr:MAG TPA: metallopeptidase toxin 4 [Crassvirales sp.]
MAQLKTDPAKKGLTPLKSIAQKAQNTGENQYFTVSQPEFIEKYRRDDIAPPANFSFPKGLDLKDYNEAVRDYGSDDLIDVEDFKAKRQGIFETIAKGTGALITNALFDTAGMVGLIYGAGKTAWDLTGGFLTGETQKRDGWSILNNFTAEENAFLKVLNDSVESVNEDLRIYKTKEDRGDIIPMNIGTVMEAVAQFGHTVPTIALTMAGIPPVITGLLSGVQEAQMEANSNRAEVNRQRDDRNYQTYLDSIQAKEDLISPYLKDFDARYDEYDRQARAAGLIDPNDTRTPNERKADAKRELISQLFQDANIQQQSATIDAAKDDLISKVTDAYKKYSDESVGALFATEAVLLSGANALMASFLGNVGSYSKSLTRGISSKIFGDKTLGKVANSTLKNTLTSTAKNLTGEALEKELAESVKGLTKRTGAKALGRKVFETLKVPANEALQEMGQEALAQASQAYTENLIDQYIKAQYDYDKVEKWQGVTDAFAEGAKGLISTEALQQGVIAALSTFIGISPNMNRKVDPNTGKKMGFPIKHNLWEQWKGMTREDKAYNSYVDEYTQITDSAKREKFQEAYRQLFASEGLGNLAANLKSQGKINESEDADMLSLYSFMNAAVQLGKTKEAFSALNQSIDSLTDEHLSSLVESSSTQEFDSVNNREFYIGGFTENGRKLNESPEDLAKVREIMKSNQEKLNRLWDSFDVAKKLVDERYEGYDFTKEQKSTLTFMYALRDSFANKAKEHLDNLESAFNVKDSIKSIDDKIAELKIAQNENSAIEDLEEFQKKDFELQKQIKDLYNQRQALNELDSVFEKGVKVNPENLSSKTISKLQSIFNNQLQVDPNNQEAREGRDALNAFLSVQNVINTEEDPRGGFIEEALKKYNQEARAEVSKEVAETLGKANDDVFNDMKELIDRLNSGAYSSEYQRERDLYKWEKLSKALRETRPEVWASYAESQVFQAMGKNIQMQMLENGAMGVFNAFSEYLARYNDFNVGKIISDDVTDFLSEMQQKYNLDDSEISDLAGAIVHIVNKVKQSYDNRLAYLRENKIQAEKHYEGPKPEEASPMNHKETEEGKVEPEKVIAITPEGEIEIELDDDGPTPPVTIEEISEEEKPELEPVDAKSHNIAPATSEHNKTIYNDKHSEYVPATEGLENTGIVSDAYQMAQLTYTTLKDAGTFEFLNSGNVEVGDEIIFGIEEEFEKKKAEAIKDKDSIYLQKPTVFMYKRLADGSLQKIGDLFTNDDSRPANKAIREAVTELYNNKGEGVTEVYLEKKDAAEDLKSFFDVSLVTGGIIKYTKDYAPITFDTTNARLGIISNGSLVTNEKSIDGRVLIRPNTAASSNGGVMILLPDIHGDYHPAFISMPTLGEAVKENPDKNIVKEVQKILAEIADINNRTVWGSKVEESEIPKELATLKKQLSKYVDLGRDMFITYKNDSRGPRILIGTVVRDEKGNRKLRPETDIDTGKVTKRFYSDIVAIPLTEGTVEERVERLTDSLSKALFYPQPDYLKDNNSGEYAQEFLSIARTNISDHRLGSVFFTTGKTVSGESARNARKSGRIAEDKDVANFTRITEAFVHARNSEVDIDMELTEDGAIIFTGDNHILSENYKWRESFQVLGSNFTEPRKALSYIRARYFGDTTAANNILNAKSIDEAEEIASHVGSQEEWNKVHKEAVILVTKSVKQMMSKSKLYEDENKIINYINYLGYRVEDSSHTYNGNDIPALDWNLFFDLDNGILEMTHYQEFVNGINPSSSTSSTDDFLSTAASTLKTPSTNPAGVTPGPDTVTPKGVETDSSETLPENPTPEPDTTVVYDQKGGASTLTPEGGNKEGSQDKPTGNGSFLMSRFKPKGNEGEASDTSQTPKTGSSETKDGEVKIPKQRFPTRNPKPKTKTREFAKYKIGEEFDFVKESNWVQSKLGWDIQKQIIQKGVAKGRNGEVQGYYDSRTGKIVLSNKATAYTLYHEAFHKLYREALHVKDKSILLSFFSSSEFLNQKDNILSDVIDEVFKMDSEEIMAELFAQYIGADTYGKPEDKKRVILALKKIESLMKFSELVNAIESNKPVEYRTPYSEENEANLRKKNWLVRTFLKLVNAFRNRTKSYRTSDGYLPIKSLFDAINKGEFNKTKIEDNAEDALEREEAGNIDPVLHSDDEVITPSDLPNSGVTEEELPDTEDKDLPEVDTELTEESEEEKLDSLMEEKEKEVINDEDKKKYQLKNNIITRYSKELDDRLNMLPFEVRVPMWYIKNALDNYGKIGFLKSYHRKADAIMRDILNTTAKESNIGTAGSVAIQKSLIEALRALKRNLKAAFPEHIETENIPDLDVNIIGNLTDIKVQRFLKNQNYKKTVNKIAGQIIAQLTAMEKAYVERVNQIKDDTSRTEALDIVERQKLCSNIFKR